MKIKLTISCKEKRELEKLLWEILWRPLGLKRNIGKSFKLDSTQIDLIAVDNDPIIGGLVTNWISDNEIEIRHLAVSPPFQRLSVGRLLVENLIKLAKQNNAAVISVWARNISVGFFKKLGFTPTAEYLEHDDFKRHGISFQKMHFKVD